MTLPTDQPTDDPIDPPVDPPSQVVTGGWFGWALVIAGAVMVLALLITTGLGRNVRAPPVVLSAMVFVLPYLYATVLAVLFGFWTAAPDRRVLPALLAIVLLAGGILWGPAIASSGHPEAEGLPVRVASWNVRRLWGGPDQSRSASTCVIDTLREVDADILALQEVSRSELGQIQSALNVSCVQTDYLRTGNANSGGLAVCVREGAWTLRSGTPARFSEGHNWYYVFAEVGQGDQIFNVLSVHLQPYRLLSGGLDQAGDVGHRQHRQSAELLRRVQRFQDPTVLAGDFNSTRDAAVHVAIRDTMTDAFEAGGRGLGSTFYLMDWLPVRIDHLYVSEAFGVQSAAILQEGCSDHRPIVSELVLRPTPSSRATGKAAD